MFDDNHMDRMMKSILENGQEEVPARVWDGISEGLDRMERRKSVVLWFRRAGVTAAAAAVALGVILNMGQEDEFVQVPRQLSYCCRQSSEQTHLPVPCSI